MNYIVFDLEATCTNTRQFPHTEMEVIEVGAVKYTIKEDTLLVVDQFQSFVKPVIHPTLTDFCKQLTTITQNQVDRAFGFQQVLSDFHDFIDLRQDYTLCSWGFYDRKQLTLDCKYHNLPIEWLEKHISLSHQYRKIVTPPNNKIKRYGVSSALEKEGLEFVGTPHRALSDAINIGRIFERHFGSWDFNDHGK